LDGELVVMTGPLDFQALQRRLATRRVEASATLVAFDLLAHDGADLRALPYLQRRDRLEQLIATSGTGLAVIPWSKIPA
jgi:ATP-dependent DNA ligase